MTLRFLITGATGFVGGHVAEECVARGHSISAIVRPDSDVSLLKKLDATLHLGDFGDAETARRALEGVDVVVHCAAKVGDLGSVEEYRAVNVDALGRMLDACVGRPLQRFIHMSSLGVYAARDHHGTDETEPLPSDHLDGYPQSKVEAEQLVMRYHKEQKLPVVVLRPGFVYGPRDRNVMPKLIGRMKTSKVHYLGGEKRALNTIYVGNLVDAVFLAVEKPEAVGQVYNLTDGEYVSKKRFFEAVADALGVKRSKQLLPLWLARFLVWVLRIHIRRATKAGRKPFLTHAQYKFLLLNLDFSIEKAKRELGYRPRVGFDEGIRETMAWYVKNV